MRFGISAEVHTSVGDKVRPLIFKIKEIVNSYIENKNYGDGVVYWGYVPIILPSSFLPPEFFQEIKRYRKSKKETEFRLKIDYGQLIKANEKEVYGLICESILRSIEIARSEFKISQFDLDAFEADIKECFRKEGWA